MNRERDRRPGQLRHGNRSGNPQAAARCGARNRRGLPCGAPALRGKRRCRLHGGHSTRPRRFKGLARLRTANTKHGRFSADGKAVAAWCRQYTRNGYQTLRALEGTMNGISGRAYAEQLRAHEAAGGIAPALVAIQRLEARAAVAAHDVQRLRAKGHL
jgi:glucans biosynthesis protein